LPLFDARRTATLYTHRLNTRFHNRDQKLTSIDRLTNNTVETRLKDKVMSFDCITHTNDRTQNDACGDGKQDHNIPSASPHHCCLYSSIIIRQHKTPCAMSATDCTSSSIKLQNAINHALQKRRKKNNTRTPIQNSKAKARKVKRRRYEIGPL
jgi:hypothetical protein